MDKRWLEISHYDGEGYRPLIDFGAWRVAFLRWMPEMLAENLDKMERHTQTDEVFVLLNGQATMILGGNSLGVDEIYFQRMDTGKLYNVKQNAWHTILLSRDATILIVENQDTGTENTEYFDLTVDLRRQIVNYE